MKIGLLWFDNDPHADLKAKVLRAAEYYNKKYGYRPNLIYANPTQAGSQERIDGIEVRPNRSILPHHFWVGISDS